MDLSFSSTIPRVLGLLLTSGALWASPALAQSPLDPTQPTPPAPVDPITASAAVSTPPVDPTATSASADNVASPLKQKARGFAVALGLTGRYIVANPDANTALAAASMGGSLFAGYKLDRIVVGLSFDIGHVDSNTKFVAAGSSSSGSRSDTSFLIGPGVQVAILRSSDLRIELVGIAQIEFGRTVTSTGQNPAIPPSYSPDVSNSNFHLAYKVAPGLRYWAHPQFALTLTTGVSGDGYFYSQDQPSGLRGDTVNTVSLFGSIGALGVF